MIELAVGLEEKTDTADEHGRGGRVWNRFEKIWLGALLNTFEKIGLGAIRASSRRFGLATLNKFEEFRLGLGGMKKQREKFAFHRLSRFRRPTSTNRRKGCISCSPDIDLRKKFQPAAF